MKSLWILINEIFSDEFWQKNQWLIKDTIKRRKKFFSWIFLGGQGVKTLPVYQLQALKFQANLLVIVFSLNITVLLQNIDSTSLNNSTGSFIIIWVIISLLTVKISSAYTTESFWDLTLNPNLKTSGFLIHRICAIKQLREVHKFIPKKSAKNSWPVLAHQTLITNLPKILNISISDSDCSFDFNTKDSMNQIFKSYLDKLQNQYPKDHFIQIFKAQFYAKNLNIYGEAIQICQKLRQGYFSTHSLTASILLLSIQKIIKTDFNPLSAKENSKKFFLFWTNFFLDESFIFLSNWLLIIPFINIQGLSFFSPKNQKLCSIFKDWNFNDTLCL